MKNERREKPPLRSATLSGNTSQLSSFHRTLSHLLLSLYSTIPSIINEKEKKEEEEESERKIAREWIKCVRVENSELREIDKDCTAGCETCLLTSINTTVNVTGIRKHFLQNEKSTWDRLKLNNAKTFPSLSLYGFMYRKSKTPPFYGNWNVSTASETLASYLISHYAVERARSVPICRFVCNFLTKFFLLSKRVIK